MGNSEGEWGYVFAAVELQNSFSIADFWTSVNGRTCFRGGTICCIRAALHLIVLSHVEGNQVL